MMWDWKSDRSRADHVAFWALAKKDWKKIIVEARGRGFCEPELADSPQRGAAGKAKHTPPASQRSSEKQPGGKVVRRLEGLEEGRLEGLEDDGPTYGEERAEEERAEAQVTESRAEKEAARAYHENL